MVYGTNDGDARRKADTVDAELRNRKAARERVVSIAVDRPEPLTLSECLVVWHEAHGKELAARMQVSYAGVWDKWIGPRLGATLLQDLTPAEVARFRAAIEREGGADGPTGAGGARLGAVGGGAAGSDRHESHAGREPPAPTPPACGAAADSRAGGDHPRRLDSEIDQALVTLLAYVGLRPQEALAAVWATCTVASS
jgi:integrase